jgi:peptidoglycan/LPS O-acetylase OafA/YrhL
LDFVRFLAFFVVFLFHLDDKRYAYGILGVPLFFVISGFLITRLLLIHETGQLGQDLRIFYARRTLRIFPLYYATLLVLLALGELPRPWWYFAYLKNVDFFLTNEWSRRAHLWSLCVEEQFYLLFPLVLWLWPQTRRLTLLVLLLLGTWIFRAGMDLWAAAHPQQEWRSFLLLPYSGEYLVWGCLAGWYDVQRRTEAAPVPAAFLIALGASLHGLMAYDQFGPGGFSHLGLAGLYQTVHGISFALIVFGVWHLPEGILKRLFLFPPFVYLGKISYGLYVFHNFLYGAKPWLMEYLPLMRYVPGAFVSLTATIGLAMVSWHLMEQPLLRLKRYFPYPRDTKPGEAPQTRKE